MPDNENRLYLRSRRHLYAHLQISQRMSANDAQSAGNQVASGQDLDWNNLPILVLQPWKLSLESQRRARGRKGRNTNACQKLRC